MASGYAVKQAADLMDAAFLARWTDREAIGPLARRGPRYACCAPDALGVAALMGEALTIHSRCHDCGDPLVLRTGPEGPLEPTTAMVWVGTREDIRAKACAGL